MQKKTKNKTIAFAKFEHRKHLKFLDKVQAESSVGFKKVMRAIFKDIRAALRKEKLSKSEDNGDKKLPQGWTQDVPTIELDLSDLLSKTIEKHLEALRWIMIGDYAGKEAVDAAKAIGLVGEVTPGILHSSYLHSLDTERKHYKELFEVKAPEIPTSLIKGSMDKINQRSERGLDLAIAQIKHGVLESVDQAIQEINQKNVSTFYEYAHNVAPEIDDMDLVLESAADSVDAVLPIRKLNDKLRATVSTLEKKWDMISSSETNLASSVGAHQAMVEVYGNDDDRLKVAWIMFEDEKTCTFCKNASKNSKGEYKLYSLSDFKPSGSNYGKKKDEWKLTIPPVHHNCRCRVLYVPSGFKITAKGDLVKA